MREVMIVGVGMHPMGRFPEKSYIDVGAHSVKEALKDAGMPWKDVQSAVFSSFFLPATTGPNILLELGSIGIPICDVENACASGCTALKFAYQQVAFGVCDVALAFGSEEMPKGLPDQTKNSQYAPWMLTAGLTQNAIYFSAWAQRHMHDYGTTSKQAAMVVVKNHRFGHDNPNAFYRNENTVEEVLNSPMFAKPLTRYMLCTLCSGSAAVLLCSKEKAKKYTNKPITLSAAVTGTATHPHFLGVGATSMSTRTKLIPETETVSKKAYEDAGIGPEDVDLAECQDADAFEEIIWSEQLGFFKAGEGGPAAERGETDIGGGKVVINPSGGLLCNGEAMGASHLRQVVENVWQLRGKAGSRQVPKAKVALAHVIGGTFNTGVSILKK